jgi:hypothetical protein
MCTMTIVSNHSSWMDSKLINKSNYCGDITSWYEILVFSDLEKGMCFLFLIFTKHGKSNDKSQLYFQSLCIHPFILETQHFIKTVCFVVSVFIYRIFYRLLHFYTLPDLRWYMISRGTCYCFSCSHLVLRVSSARRQFATWYSLVE